MYGQDGGGLVEVEQLLLAAHGHYKLVDGSQQALPADENRSCCHVVHPAASPQQTSISRFFRSEATRALYSEGKFTRQQRDQRLDKTIRRP